MLTGQRTSSRVARPSTHHARRDHARGWLAIRQGPARFSPRAASRETIVACGTTEERIVRHIDRGFEKVVDLAVSAVKKIPSGIRGCRHREGGASEKARCALRCLDHYSEDAPRDAAGWLRHVAGRHFTPTRSGGPQFSPSDRRYGKLHAEVAQVTSTSNL